MFVAKILTVRSHSALYTFTLYLHTTFTPYPSSQFCFQAYSYLFDSFLSPTISSQYAIYKRFSTNGIYYIFFKCFISDLILLGFDFLNMGTYFVLYLWCFATVAIADPLLWLTQYCTIFAFKESRAGFGHWLTLFLFNTIFTIDFTFK